MVFFIFLRILVHRRLSEIHATVLHLGVKFH